jgi:prepilin-type N-terminal cleavage/methylation domain-containing protein
MAAFRRTGGLTLIELLIAITILSLVIGIATYGFSLFSQHWGGPRTGFERAAGQMQRVDLMSKALRDALPWIVRNDKGAPGFYFLGREEGLTLVTASPIYTSDGPAVVRIFREPEGTGSFRLVYEEAPLSGVLLRDASQVLPFRHRLIVLEKMTGISFRYFGWRSITEQLQADEPGNNGVPSWWDEFDGIVRAVQPQRVGIRFGSFEAVYAMPDRSRTLMDRASPL